MKISFQTWGMIVSLVALGFSIGVQLDTMQMLQAHNTRVEAEIHRNLAEAKANLALADANIARINANLSRTNANLEIVDAALDTAMLAAKDDPLVMDATIAADSISTMTIPPDLVESTP